MEFLQDNLWLVAALIGSGALLVWPSVAKLFGGAKEANSLQATQLINHQDALVLDVREEKEFQAGHIPGARHIPGGQLGGRLKELERFKTRPILVNCRSGMRSATACNVLHREGFTEVYNLKGGIAAWEQANLPLEKGKAGDKPRPSEKRTMAKKTNG